MPHFIIFERALGHCEILLVKAETLKEALTKYAVDQYKAQVNKDGSLISWGGICYPHPLALIESEHKSNDKYDELQWDNNTQHILNGSCWEIRALPSEALAVDTASVFCSAEPWSLSEYISLCRTELRKKHPRSRARAFVW